MRGNNQTGRCRHCGVELVDWARVHQRDLSDADHTFDSLRKEFIRHHFWHEDIDQKAVDHARRKGKLGLKVAALRRLESSIGSAAPYRDGYQTPYTSNILYYAQHAVGCCCRTCLEYWHKIPCGQALTGDELAYLTELVMLYVNERMPSLTEDGEKVPRRSAKKPRN